MEGMHMVECKFGIYVSNMVIHLEIFVKRK
jgi:hypothetical protein